MQHLRTITAAAAISAVVAIGAATAATANGGATHGAAALVDASGTTVGFAKFVEDGDGRVHVNVKISGLTPGLHGAHIHEIGSCTSPTGTFSGAGAHHREAGTDHPHHYGDLPNLVVNAAGRGHLEATTTRASLVAGPSSIFDGNGSAIVIHALEDQFDVTNFGGPRVACGVISPG
jgi:superoxide dismutase, Cu-Zn family